MNSIRSLPLLAVVVAVAAAGGWFAARSFRPGHAHPGPASTESTRKVLFYQSAMHPWIKSDKPGKCTICGMELTPVFEGDSGLALDPGLVALSSNSITVLHVQSAQVRRGALVRTLRVAGVLEDDDTRHQVLSAWVGGRIDRLHVNYPGAEVVAGQPLARFYSPMLLEAERQFLSLQAQPGSTSLPPERTLLHDAAIQRLRQLGLADSQIAELPSKSSTNIFSEILAPVGGTVVERFVFPGQYVMEGEKLFEIADFSVLWFVFDAYEQDLAFLSIDQEIEVSAPSAPGRVFKAPIRFIDPNLSEMTRSAKVRVEVSNPVVAAQPLLRRALSHRAYAEGRVRTAIPDTLLVPRSAVLSPAGNPVVYVEKAGGIYEPRPVQLGRFGDSDYEVLAGLAPQDTVVTHGNLMIDAQAQLDRSVRSAAPGPSETNALGSTNLAARLELSQEQAASLREFLRLADSARAALAGDDLPRFETAVVAIGSALVSLRASTAWTSDLESLLEPLTAQRIPPASSDLRAARMAYHSFSVRLVALARALRSRVPAFADLKIYRCPMTAEAFDGAPTRSEWLQLSPPLRNPWFGAEMLECGVEVRD